MEANHTQYRAEPCPPGDYAAVAGWAAADDRLVALELQVGDQAARLADLVADLQRRGLLEHAGSADQRRRTAANVVPAVRPMGVREGNEAAGAGEAARGRENAVPGRNVNGTQSADFDCV